MIFTATALAGAYVVDMDRLVDDRGFFARSFCAAEFAAQGLPASFPQCSVSFNARKATLRGLHLQADPHAEDKLIRCTAGAIFDVIVDLRPRSPTHRRWTGVDLTADNRRALFVPGGFAHGFLTLTDGAEVLYMMSVPYARASGQGVRWNDPALAIGWPLVPEYINDRDASYPLLDVPAVP